MWAPFFVPCVPAALKLGPFGGPDIWSSFGCDFSILGVDRPPVFSMSQMLSIWFRRAASLSGPRSGPRHYEGPPDLDEKEAAWRSAKKVLGRRYV